MKHQFHSGDLVCFREWNELAAEYGLVRNTIGIKTIRCPFGLSIFDYTLLDSPVPIKEIRYGYSIISGASGYYAVLDTDKFESLRCNMYALEILLPADIDQPLEITTVSDAEFYALLGG